MFKQNRLTQQTTMAMRKKRKLFCAYITLGYTRLSTTERLLTGLERVGVDILELGFPFSDPLADGPNIQGASEHALRHSITIDDAQRMVCRVRSRGVTMPVVFFSYFNPILQYGVSRFATKLRAAGFDGVIVPDLPPDEDPGFLRTLKKAGLSFVHLVAPTSRGPRAKFLVRRSDDFVYYVSRRGVTGERRSFEKGLAGRVQKLRRYAKKPVLIGFGISSPEQARQAVRFSDGVVVGSALITAIRMARGRTGPVLRLARRFARAVHDGN